MAPDTLINCLSSSNDSSCNEYSNLELEINVKITPGLEFMLYFTNEDGIPCKIECLLCNSINNQIINEGSKALLNHVYTKHHLCKYIELKYSKEYSGKFPEFAEKNEKDLMKFIKVR